MMQLEQLQKKGAAMMMTPMDLVSYVAKDFPLRNFQILIISRDIVADSQVNTGNTVRYRSAYDNVDFMMTVVPSGGVINMKYSYDTEKGNQEFELAYDNQLSADDAFTDLVCMVDMVVNDHVPVIMLCSNVDFQTGFPEQIRRFVYDRFGFSIYTIDDALDPTLDVTDYGDEEEIRKAVAEYKVELTENHDEQSFFNWLTDSLFTKYRDVLMKKTPEQLARIASENGIFVRRNATKEAMVDRIVSKYCQRH